MSAEEKADAGGSKSDSGSGGGKLVMILTIVNLLATLGMVAVLFISFQKDKTKPSVEDIAAHSPEEGHGEGGEKKEGGDGHGGGHGDGHGGGKEPAKKSVEFGKMVTLDQFTVNLSTPGSVAPKFARVNISLEVPTADAETEVTFKMPQIRNAIIDLFNSKRASDLATSEGRDYLKEEIKNALNSFMITGKVKGVYFTNIAVSG